MERGVTARVRSVLTGVLGCSLLTACGLAGTAGFEAPRENVSTIGSLGQKLGDLVAFNTMFPSATPLPPTEGPIECPTIEVLDGTSSVRVYTGGDQANDHVRYGFSLGDIARECSRAGDQIILKVGAEGRVLLGPAGSPGAFTIPIRIAVRNDNTQKVLTSQLARVPAAIGGGETQTAFNYVSDPISVPYLAHPDEDYVILVGFDPNNQGVQAGTNPRKKKHK